jgi:hypothetical protein
MGADLRVQGPDRPARLFEVGPDGSVGRGRTFVEISDFQRQKKFLQDWTALTRFKRPNNIIPAPLPNWTPWAGDG